MKTVSGIIPITLSSLMVFVYMIFYSSLREFGATGLLITLIFSAISSFFAKEIKLFTSLIPFYIFSLFILFLSFTDAMPDGWTHYRDSFAALRHWAWLPTLTLVGSACFILVKLHWQWIVKYSLQLAVAIFCLSRLSKYIFGSLNNIEEDFFLYGLVNENAPIIALSFIYIHCRSDKLWKSIIVGILLLLMCRSMTSIIVAVMGLLGIWLSAHRLLMISSIVGCALFVVGAQTFYREIHSVDANTAVRGLFWRDSATLVTQTYGIGVGYGTEYVRNDFRGLVKSGTGRFVDEGAEDRLYLGTHSSFYDVIIRVGVIGLLLLLWGLVKEIGGRPVSVRLERLRFSMISALIFNNVFNMGLASINLTFGTALFLAIAIACRASPENHKTSKFELFNNPNLTSKLYTRKPTHGH